MLKKMLNLRFFDGYTNVTTDTGLSEEMKVFYSKYLIDLAEPELVHSQFAQKHHIPKNGGKTIEFRKYDPLPKALTPLTEGVTPNGQKLSMSTISATVAQYGGFVELSDILLMTAIDNNLLEAIRLLASQGGRTLDTVTREVLNGGTNVIFSGDKDARSELVGGEASGNDYLSVLDVRKAVRKLKLMNAKKINGDYVGIIHSDTEFDLMSDPDWKYPHQYVDTKNMYEGELGKVAGVRFVETSEAKIFGAEDLTEGARELTVKTQVSASTSVAVKEAITADDAAALKDRKVIIGDAVVAIVSATAGAAGSASITLASAVSAAADTVIFPGEAGAEGRSVYSTMIIGADAYGDTDITGGGMEQIVKQLGSAGTSDPLNQRATAGWKASKACVRLVEPYMVRIESCSTYNEAAN